MRHRALGAAGAILAIAAMVGAAGATDRRPMSATFTVAVVPVEQRCGPNALTVGFEGVGMATHLGRMTGTGSNCTQFTLASEEVPIWDGLVTYVAADGSTLRTTYQGVQRAPSGGRAEVETAETIVGGTGRFAQATGELTGSGVLDFATGLFTGRVTGWISY